MFFSQSPFKAWDTGLILHGVFMVLIGMNKYLLVWCSLLLAFLVKYMTISSLVWIIRGILVDKRQGNGKNGEKKKISTCSLSPDLTEHRICPFGQTSFSSLLII